MERKCERCDKKLEMGVLNFCLHCYEIQMAEWKAKDEKNRAKKLDGCQHDKFEVRHVSHPYADGTEDAKVTEVVCSECGKKLAEQILCISDDSVDVYDKEWGKRHPYYTVP